MAQPTIAQPSQRLYSLDALRGLDMFWIIGGEEIFHSLSKITGSPFWGTLSEQFDHPKWNGFHLNNSVAAWNRAPGRELAEPSVRQRRRPTLLLVPTIGYEEQWITVHSGLANRVLRRQHRGRQRPIGRVAGVDSGHPRRAARMPGERRPVLHLARIARARRAEPKVTVRIVIVVAAAGGVSVNPPQPDRPINRRRAARAT